MQSITSGFKPEILPMPLKSILTILFVETLCQWKHEIEAVPMSKYRCPLKWNYADLLHYTVRKCYLADFWHINDAVNAPLCNNKRISSSKRGTTYDTEMIMTIRMYVHMHTNYLQGITSLAIACLNDHKCLVHSRLFSKWGSNIKCNV